jgi:hypothetical protein
MKRITLAATIVLLAFLAGCGKDNPVQPLPPGPKYLPFSTPQNALENMRRAYVTRDTLGYDSTFDAAYIGESIDQLAASPILLTFTKADESQHIRALARTGTIHGINFVFPPTLRRETDAADTLGWATVGLYPFQIEIDDGISSLIVGPLETMTFKLRPVAPSPASPTDTTWRIVRWTEVRN